VQNFYLDWISVYNYTPGVFPPASSQPITNSPTTTAVTSSPAAATTTTAAAAAPSLPPTTAILLCAGPPPVPGASCIDGLYWLANNTVSFTQSQTNLTLPLVVRGNFSIVVDSSTVVAVYNGVPVLNVSGIATLHGTLVVLLLSNSTLLPVAGQFVPLVTATSLASPFASVRVQSTDSCMHYTTSERLSTDSTLLGVLIESVSDSCGGGNSSFPWWIILVVLVVVLLILSILFVGWWLRRRGYPAWLWRDVNPDD